MDIEVIGISGSPIRNSNTDRLVKEVLESTGLETEFVKLSNMNIRPCLACKGCVSDNVCKVKDDFQQLSEKIKKAKALVIGSYIPYSQIDGFTKALLERFWSLRHVNNLLKEKLCVTVLTGLAPDALSSANQSLAVELRDYERMELVGQLTASGNLPCMTCGNGDVCQMSGVKDMYGPNACTEDFEYARVEAQKEVWEEAERVGLLIGSRIRNS